MAELRVWRRAGRRRVTQLSRNAIESCAEKKGRISRGNFSRRHRRGRLSFFHQCEQEIRFRETASQQTIAFHHRQSFRDNSEESRERLGERLLRTDPRKILPQDV